MRHQELASKSLVFAVPHGKKLIFGSITIGRRVNKRKLGEFFRGFLTVGFICEVSNFFLVILSCNIRRNYSRLTKKCRRFFDREIIKMVSISPILVVTLECESRESGGPVNLF